MRMPGIDPAPLPDHLEQIRQMISALPRKERQILMGRLHGDISRANDLRHAEAADRAERARKRPGQLQMSLESAA